MKVPDVLGDDGPHVCLDHIALSVQQTLDKLSKYDVIAREDVGYLMPGHVVLHTLLEDALDEVVATSSGGEFNHNRVAFGVEAKLSNQCCSYLVVLLC